MPRHNRNIIASGIRGLACAGFSTALTAFLSWTYIPSAHTMNWTAGAASVGAASAAIHPVINRG